MNILTSLFFTLIVFFVGCTEVTTNPGSEVVGGQAIYAALEDQNIPDLISALNDKPDINDLSRFHDSRGDTVVHLLVSQNDVPSFLSLSKNYTLPYNRYNNNYDTPLSVAIDRGNCQILELLLIKGADPSLVTENHMVLLSQAVLQKRYPCMETLLVNSDTINQKGTGDWEPLHYAAYGNDIKAVKILAPYNPNYTDTASLENGAPFVDQNSVLNVGNLNPFHIAVLKSYLALAKELLKLYPEYIETLTSNGTTNTELAKMSGSPAMVSWIALMTKKGVPISENKESDSMQDTMVVPAALEQNAVFDEGMKDISRTSKNKKKGKRKSY